MALKKEKSILESIIKPETAYIDIYSHRKIWLELEEEIGGEFKVIKTKNQDIEIHRYRLPYRKWQIEFRISDTRPLKVRVEFSQSKDFSLVISWEDLIDRILKKFKKPEVQLGWDKFDHHYLIDTNQAELLRKIIPRDIQKAFLENNIYNFSYQTDHAGKAELISLIQRHSPKKEKVIGVIKMFQKIIDRLIDERIIK